MSDRDEMMKGAEPSAWFDAFRVQSHDREHLGELNDLITPKVLTGGKSGASAALFRPTEGAVVLKWDHVENILNESEVRKARVDQRSSLERLRGRGASHVALRLEPSCGAMFGIMAYPYLGPRDDFNLVGDFEWFIREKYLKSNDAGDGGLEEAFKLFLDHLKPIPQHDGKSRQDLEPQNLPDLAKWGKTLRFVKAAGIAGDNQTLEDLQGWVDGLLERQHELSVKDSRLLHGDTRFANIMVNFTPGMHGVDLIDFGAGDPSGGGHVFRDLARFEVDILLRVPASSPQNPDRLTDIAARTRATYLYGVKMLDSVPEVKVAEIWRKVRDDQLKSIRFKKARELHAIFVAMELLRRLKWHVELEGDADTGGTVAELLAATRALMEAVPK